MYFECSLNKNKNINEWYDYLSEKQNYNYINRNNDEIDNAILSQKMIKDLFGIVNNLNEKLFSKEDVEDIKLYLFENKIFFYKFFNKIESKYEFFKNAIIINIIKFACILTNNEIKFEDFFNDPLIGNYILLWSNKFNYFAETNDSFISKMKEIYEIGSFINILSIYLV